MAQPEARPLAKYVGPITDNSRWENFRHRPDDIFICTPPKCGTTWTQAICAMLVFGKADHGLQPGVISPWIDAQFAPIEEYLQQVEAQQHRRFIKTHTPFDGIPYYPECTYLVVLRDPRDVFCSIVNHRENMTDQEMALSVFPSGESAFEDWLDIDFPVGSWDAQSLKLITDFLGTYWENRGLRNVHFFHYSDMKRDTRSTIASMAKALNVPLNESLLDAMTEAAGFSHMQKNAEQFAPNSGTGMWKQESSFFANGSNEQWKRQLSEQQLLRFEQRLADLLPKEQAQWLSNVSG